MLFGGMAHRRADTVSRQVDELGEAIEAVEDHLQAAEAARSERATMPGMPLPTGYGLQLRGPDEESIVLPVCLPPGFELASMVLCPEFLQYVFGSTPGFSMDETFGGAVEADPPRPARARGVETHHLA